MQQNQLPGAAFSAKLPHVQNSHRRFEDATLVPTAFPEPAGLRCHMTTGRAQDLKIFVRKWRKKWEVSGPR